MNTGPASSVVFAVAERYPPMDWRTRASKSAHMKRYVYVFGANLERVFVGS